MSSAQRRITSYNYYFRQIYKKRLQYVNKVLVLLSIFVSFALAARYQSLSWAILSTIYRVPIIFTALYTIKLCRERNSTVEYSKSKTLAQHIAVTVASKRYVGTLVSFCISSYALFGIFLTQLPLLTQYYIESKEYRRRPSVNDEWVFFWWHANCVAVVYTFQHLIFQRNKLKFVYGVVHVKPESGLFHNIVPLLGPSLVFTAFASFASPVAYCFLRLIIYRSYSLLFTIIGLDLSVPSLRLPLKTLASVSFASFVINFGWELVNHTFDVYATVGCLDGKKPISSYSSEPISTLLSGLRDVDPENLLARLTAFQELAYIATSTDPDGAKLREELYSAKLTGGFVWPAILDECALMIRDVSSRVNYRSKRDLEALAKIVPSLGEELKPANEKSLFGNSNDVSDTTDTSVRMFSATSSPVKESKSKPSFLTRIEKSPLAKSVEANLMKQVEALVARFFSPSPGKPKSISDYITSLKNNLHQMETALMDSNIGVLFRVTVRRDAESRVLNPVNYGNAVLGLSGLLMHAVEQDRKHNVTDAHISEVLNLLERPIRAFANYTDVLPALVYTPTGEQLRAHIVAVLHDLTMSRFFKLCVKYNYKLSDLLLLSRAFKLAKWVIDVSIAQQLRKPQSVPSI